jgi:hypothetical protein
MAVWLTFWSYPKAAGFDANLKQRFFGVYSYCEKLKTEQDEING